MASGASDVFFLEGVPPSIKVDGLVSPVAGADALDAVAMRAVIEGPRTGVLFDLKGKTAYPLPMKSRISSKGQVTVLCRDPGAARPGPGHRRPVSRARG